MKAQRRISRFLVAVALTIATATASATPLIEYQGTTSTGVTNQNQPLAKVVVGASNVSIGSFGVYGQAQVAGNIKFLIFDSTANKALVYLSDALPVPGRAGTFASQAMWYESPGINFTLLANHTYAMGLIADKVGTNTFRWGSSADTPFGPWPTITANGLSLPFMQALDNSGLVSGAFSATPTLYTTDNSNRSHVSLHINAVPEPAEWTMLVAGLLVVSFIAARRQHS